MRFLAILCLPLVLLLCPACSSISYDARAERSWSASSVSSNDLEISTRNGSVEVVVDPTASASAAPAATASTAWTGAPVRIDASIRATGASQQEADRRLSQVTITTAERNGRLFIEPVLPEGWRSNDAVSLKVVVPTANCVNVSTSNGSISVAQLGGPADLRTSNGPISARAVAGAVTARTSNGRIDIEDAGGAVRAESSNGRIVVRGAPGPVEVETSNGRLELIDVGGPLDASSSNGGVEILLRAGFGGTLEASTSNGRITLDAAPSVRRSVAERSRATLEFFNPGQASRVRTSNGSVEIRTSG